MVMDQDTQWLYQLLADVQLEKFYLRVRDGLNITRLEHFTYVKESDLEQIGISKPGEHAQYGIPRFDLSIQPGQRHSFCFVLFQLKGDYGRL